jgi:hypothetical protein
MHEGLRPGPLQPLQAAQAGPVGEGLDTPGMLPWRSCGSHHYFLPSKLSLGPSSSPFPQPEALTALPLLGAMTRWFFICSCGSERPISNPRSQSTRDRAGLEPRAATAELHTCRRKAESKAMEPPACRGLRGTEPGTVCIHQIATT